MLNYDTPLGTRVFRNFDGKAGTVVKIVHYYPDGTIDEGSVAVYLDDDDQVWSGTYEAWDLADGDLDQPDQPTSDEIFTLIRETIGQQHQAGIEVGRYIYKHDTDLDAATKRKDAAQARADRAVQAMWRALYDWNAR